jgi:2-oxoglutarate ferredoxin oxidoreductase subunit gamma
MRRTGILIGGQGGQGVLELGNYIAYHALAAGKHVAYTPSYGPESRGGRVKCFVVISDDIIDSPIVEHPDYLIAMNIQSMEFVQKLAPGGTLLMNSSLIEGEAGRKDIAVFTIPATGIAAGIAGSGKHGKQDTRIAANCVMLGSYLELSNGGADNVDLTAVFDHFLKGSKSRFVPVNMEAAKLGRAYASHMKSEVTMMLQKDRGPESVMPMHNT